MADFWINVGKFYSWFAPFISCLGNEFLDCQCLDKRDLAGLIYNPLSTERFVKDLSKVLSRFVLSKFKRKKWIFLTLLQRFSICRIVASLTYDANSDADICFDKILQRVSKQAPLLAYTNHHRQGYFRQTQS